MKAFIKNIIIFVIMPGLLISMVRMVEAGINKCTVNGAVSYQQLACDKESVSHDLVIKDSAKGITIEKHYVKFERSTKFSNLARVGVVTQGQTMSEVITAWGNDFVNNGYIWRYFNGGTVMFNEKGLVSYWAE